MPSWQRAEYVAGDAGWWMCKGSSPPVYSILRLSHVSCHSSFTRNRNICAEYLLPLGSSESVIIGCFVIAGLDGPVIGRLSLRGPVTADGDALIRSWHINVRPFLLQQVLKEIADHPVVIHHAVLPVPPSRKKVYG